MKKIICTLLTIVLCFGAGSTSADAAKVKGVTLKNKKVITKYDLTGDGKKDKVYISCDNQDECFSEYGSGWKISVNSKVVYQASKFAPQKLSVKYYRVNHRRCYLDIQEDMIDNEDITAHGLYQYQSGKLKKVCDFYKPILRCTQSFHYNVSIKSMTSKKLVISCRDQFYSTGWLRWNVSYQYRAGKWKKTGGIYSITGSCNKQNNHTSIYTANRTIRLTRKPGGKTKFYTVKSGDKVKIKKICLKNKQTYIQLTTLKGKKGWYKNPKKYVEPYFKNIMLAGKTTSKNKKAHILYEKKIKSINKKWNKMASEHLEKKGNYFAYYDINGDGVDECLMYHDAYGEPKNSKIVSGGRDVAIYTYYKGKIKKIIYSYNLGSMEGIYFYKNCKYIEHGICLNADSDYQTFYKISNGKLTKTGKSCGYRLDYETGKAVYTVNDKVVSKKKYTKMQNRMTGKKGIKMYRVNSKNLKKKR